MSAPYHYNPSPHDASRPGESSQPYSSPSYYDGSEQQAYYPRQGLYGQTFQQQSQQQQGYHNYSPTPYNTTQYQQDYPSYSHHQSGYATAYGGGSSHPQPAQPGNQGYYGQNPQMQSQATYSHDSGSSSYYPPQQQPYQGTGPSCYNLGNERYPQMGQSSVRPPSPPPPPPNDGKKGKGSKVPDVSGGGIGHGLLGAAGGALAGVAGMGLVGQLRKRHRNHKYGHRRGSSSGSGSGSSSSSATSDSSSSNNY